MSSSASLTSAHFHVHVHGSRRGHCAWIVLHPAPHTHLSVRRYKTPYASEVPLQADTRWSPTDSTNSSTRLLLLLVSTHTPSTLAARCARSSSKLITSWLRDHTRIQQLASIAKPAHTKPFSEGFSSQEVGPSYRAYYCEVICANISRSPMRLLLPLRMGIYAQ
jgi:hypothetical protein